MKALSIAIRGGVSVVVPNSLRLLTPYVLLEQEDWFEDEIAFVRRFLQPGMRAVDIGASYGVYTLSMAKRVGPEGRIWAFEPARGPRAFLEDSMRKNGFENTVLYPIALSDRNGLAELRVGANTEMSMLGAAKDQQMDCEKVAVRQLDSLLEETGLQRIDFVKMDAEGEESRILDAAREFLRCESPLILFELKHGNRFNRQLLDQFARGGYGIYRLVPGLQVLVPFETEASIDPYQLNLFACKPDRASALLKERLLVAVPADGPEARLTAPESWASYLSRFAYARNLLDSWRRRGHAGRLPNVATYLQALDHYAHVQDEATEPALRYAHLTRAFMLLSQVVRSEGNLSRCQSMARVAWELGERATAVENLNRCLTWVRTEGEAALDEPFLTVSPRFESLDPSGRMGEWCIASLLEQREKLRLFSSYYADPPTTLEVLEYLGRLGFYAPEMERRRQLIRLRCHMQHYPQPHPLLENNRNASFWLGGDSAVDMSYLDKALEHHRAGRLAQAEAAYRQALEQQPEEAEALHLLGMLYLQSDRLDLAVEYIKRAIQRRPDVPDYHYDLGIALAAQRRVTEAEQQFRSAIELKPDFAEAHNNLGNTLKEQGKTEEAIQCYRRALELRPSSAAAHNNLGALLQEQDRGHEAITHYRRALEIDPADADTRYNLANALRAIGDLEEAVGEYRAAVAIRPDLLEAYVNLSKTLKDLDRLSDAAEVCRVGISIQPRSALLHINLGNVLEKLGNKDDAIAAYRTAIAFDPNCVEGYYNLGNALNAMGELSQAIAAFERSLLLKPDFAEALNNLANTLKDQGRLKAAIDRCNEALRVNPYLTDAHSNLFHFMHYSPGFDIETIFTEAQRWNEQHAQTLVHVGEHPNERTPDRRLRVGYVSADLRRHPVGWFFAPVFAHHDRSRFELFCYSAATGGDELTDFFRGHADHWFETATISDLQLAKQIFADRIDILVDLAGHTGRNRLLTFARRPAPVQVTAGGHYDTTGLETIDYLIADHFHAPPGADRFFSETLIRMPHDYVCYDPPPYSPAVAVPPVLNREYITFGCYNNLAKINEGVVALWSQILRALPGSKLRLQTPALTDASTRERYQQLFTAEGVSRERLNLVGKVPHEELLAAYAEIDVALDPFPYSGGVTTCEALWMGVPVVTLTGQNFCGRHSTSHLSNVGLHGLVTTSPADYIATTLSLAQDVPRLIELRKTLRERMAGSPLCDGRRYTNDLEKAYRDMWRKYCESNE